MKVGIIGHEGVIGSTLQNYLWEELGHSTYGYDIADSKSALIDVQGTDICFICVPTPGKIDQFSPHWDKGRCDTKIVEDTVDHLVNHIRYKGVIAIRSTVEPGTTLRLFNRHIEKNPRICYIPEFLREHSARQDIQDQHITVIGYDGDRHPTLATCLSDVCGVVEEVFTGGQTDRFKRHYDDIVLESGTAEFLKYFHNSLNATKITFANVFYELMNKYDDEYENMIKAWERVNNSSAEYLRADRNTRGFGGPCLPKDTSAIYNMAKQNVLEKPHLADFLSSVLETNSQFPITVPEGMREE